MRRRQRDTPLPPPRQRACAPPKRQRAARRHTANTRQTGVSPPAGLVASRCRAARRRWRQQQSWQRQSARRPRRHTRGGGWGGRPSRSRAQARRGGGSASVRRRSQSVSRHGLNGRGRRGGSGRGATTAGPLGRCHQKGRCPTNAPPLAFEKDRTANDGQARCRMAVSEAAESGCGSGPRLLTVSTSDRGRGPLLGARPACHVQRP